ncbi:M17 family metallopeptidase [Spiroplasma tabanidicola]|uniref:Probable cytosol aminopeptidase n=1 Tax=Spiroplasma tabanidicola TaxID=324079 RepID=A0A6I6CEJ4_9MOLU|nr:leucyl aminopeptidase family protein [Spiroplasma tabanidicola]QGS52394.1 leucyl aminopeptidase family protein [Spiroplasma tabanidicola]
MITTNKKLHSITVKAITKDAKVNPVVILESGSLTLVSEDKTIYYCLDPKAKAKCLANAVSSIVGSAKYDLNVDVNSFLEIVEEKEGAFQAIVEQFLFLNHKPYEMKKEGSKQKSFDLIFDSKYQDEFNKAEIKLEFVNFARDLQDLPPNVGTSVIIANKIKEKASLIEGLKVSIMGRAEAEKLGMGSFLSVNDGSHVEGQIVVLEYCTDSSLPKTAYVGKGITFDSGGYNLKPSASLAGMKFDMSGCAIVSSTVMALAKAKAKCNVVAVGMLTDNRIGGHATLTESVVKSMNGQTIEIGNTDAEGRLVLVDGMTYAIRNLKAERLVTVATLTGAMTFSLGRWFTGTFTNNEEFLKEFNNAAKDANEPVWNLPLIKEHLKVMQTSKIADLSNTGNIREAGSSTAAAFLNAFSEEKPYIHLDIALTADRDGRGLAPMTRTLFEMLNK